MNATKILIMQVFISDKSAWEAGLTFFGQ